MTSTASPINRNKTSKSKAQPKTNTDAITFEQPMNETFRLCLRLEALFTSVRSNCHASQAQSCHAAMRALLGIIELTNRSDLKSKIIQSLIQFKKDAQQSTTMTEKNKTALTEKLQAHCEYLLSNQQRIGEQLRQNEFLNATRLNYSPPGDGAEFNAPTYALWLRKSQQNKQQQIKDWLAEFRDLESICTLLLLMSRKNNDTQIINCEQGFYQQILDSHAQYHLLQVTIPLDLNIHPEFSIGKHRLCIRFLRSNIKEDKTSQVTNEFKFKLTLKKTDRH